METEKQRLEAEITRLRAALLNAELRTEYLNEILVDFQRTTEDLEKLQMHVNNQLNWIMAKEGAEAAAQVGMNFLSALPIIGAITAAARIVLDGAVGSASALSVELFKRYTWDTFEAVKSKYRQLLVKLSASKIDAHIREVVTQRSCHQFKFEFHDHHQQQKHDDFQRRGGSIFNEEKPIKF